MNGFPEFTVRRVSWSEAGGQLRAIRTTVFIDEQNVPVELEWDGLDVQCLHVVAESATGEAIGTGRLLPDGHIGRMAVLKPWRGRGVGRALLLELLAAAGDGGFESVELNAQTRAIDFYARFGFRVMSGEFMDAGITHRTMRVDLIKGK
jgi:predicted GNAT family N-acyltransferase